MTEGRKASVSAAKTTTTEVRTAATTPVSAQTTSAPAQVQFVEPVKESQPGLFSFNNLNVNLFLVVHEEPHQEVGPPESVVALYDYTADEEGELTFKEGDIIHIIAKDPSGWWRLLTILSWY